LRFGGRQAASRRRCHSRPLHPQICLQARPQNPQTRPQCTLKCALDALKRPTPVCCSVSACLRQFRDTIGTCLMAFFFCLAADDSTVIQHSQMRPHNLCIYSHPHTVLTLLTRPPTRALSGLNTTPSNGLNTPSSPPPCPSKERSKNHATFPRTHLPAHPRRP
jgi:hypothetical protein